MSQDRQSPQEYFQAANSSVSPHFYNGDKPISNHILFAAKHFLDAARQNPTAFKSALDTFRETRVNNLDDLLSPEQREHIDGLSGYQWHEAVRIAAFVTEQADVVNPTVLSVG